MISKNRIIAIQAKTGKLRGAEHACNLKLKVPKCVPIFFYNFTRYACHLFIIDLAIIPHEIKVIPLNKEQYISISKNITISNGDNFEIRVLDSFRFMTALDTLASNLDSEQMYITRPFFPNENHFNLMRRKGVFPYEYLDSVEKLKESKLPPREAFYSSLTENECLIENYTHAQKV